MRTKASLAVVIALAHIVTACGSTASPSGSSASEPAGSTAAEPGGSSTGEPSAPTAGVETLTIALADVPREQFDPSRGTATAKVYQALMYDWLIGAQPNGEFDNSVGVAEDWEHSADGLTFTVTVREGISFWDGSPLTADDVVFSLQRIIDPEATSSGSASLRGVIESVTKTGDSTVDLNLTTPYLFLPHLLSRLGATDGAIISKAHFESVGAEAFASAPMGSGRYALTSSEAGTTYTFERNDDYWLGADGRFATIVLENVPEEQTRLALLQRGDADIVGLSAEAASTLSADAIQVAVQPGKANLSVNYVEQWKPENPLSNALFREALNLSINREEILETIFHGRGDLVGVPQMGPSHVGYDPSEFRLYEYDPERAREVLEDSGYLDDPVQLDLYEYTWPGVPELPQVMEAVAGYFTAIGVNVRQIRTDYSTFREGWGAFELGPAVAANAADNRPVYPLDLIWSSGGSLTYVHDPDLDELLSGFAAASSIEEAEAAIHEIAAYLRDNNIGTAIMIVATIYGLGEGVEPWDGLESEFPFEMSLDGLLTSP